MGNLRTALIAWACARKSGRKFFLRLEDLDKDRARDPQVQIDDLREIGIDWDSPIIIQSERLHLYEDAIRRLKNDDLIFECFCSRRDIREAASAAHSAPSSYPGPCSTLTEVEREAKRAKLAARGAKPALRFKPQVLEWTIHDELHGEVTRPVEQVVLQRGDGAFAYNLAVVVDDLCMGIDQVVRGDDLLDSAPTQAYLSQVLGGMQPDYVHVPLVLGPSGNRLAKRDGAVTLKDFRSRNVTGDQVFALIADSTGMGAATDSRGYLESFELHRLTREPWTYVHPGPENGNLT